MPQFLPLTLSGENLGQRHRFLNAQVNQAVDEQLSFQDFERVPEETAVDRLFKIDLAVKLKNIDYILQNLKDDDMLYVSRALKCKWLLEQRDVINPKYLENMLFPEMVMPAISKMKHWLYINLRDPIMCREFYLYYKDTKFDYAVKFLKKCDNEFVLIEFPRVMIKLTPQNLKVFGEKCPELVNIYFEALATDNELVKRYLENERQFFKSVTYLLKSNLDKALDITEKYHSVTFSHRFSPLATKYIIRFRKNRFMAKPELYVVYLLHIPTVAKSLTMEECQDVIVKLARADYLSSWFSYENVEHFVKRIDPDKRTAFKKRVFVEKDVGVRLAEWPYLLPASPIVNDYFDNSHIFHDHEYPSVILQGNTPLCFRSVLKKRKYAKWGEKREFIMTELQKLFNEFRYKGFDATFHELKRRIGATSSADRRRDMLLVLVSKSGGRPDAVRTLFQLALRLRNEPVHERAAVVRSLVKRASVWRLPQDVWDTMLEYARGLGLDGTKPEANCCEGLHSVVIRQLITTGDCEPALRTAFLDHFSTLTEYKLVEDERIKIAAGLQNILVTAASNAEPKKASYLLGQLLDVLEKYRIRIQSSIAISSIAELAERDSEAARPLLMRLYKARVGRRELIRQYLVFQHDDAALLNALRHEPDVIMPEWFVKLLSDGETRASQFLMKLAVYFNESGGFAERIWRVLQEKIAQKPDVELARPLAMLAGDICLILRQQAEVDGKPNKLSAALMANMHRARPAPDAMALGWRKVGMKAVAWSAMRCRPALVTRLAKTMLEERTKRTVRLALILAQRSDCAPEMFSRAVTIRPLAVLRAALLYYRKFDNATDSRIWDIVKPLMTNLDLTSRKGLSYILQKVEWIPESIKPDYCAVLYLLLCQLPGYNNNYMPVPVKDLMKYQPKISKDLLDNVSLQMLRNLDMEDAVVSYAAFVIRYLMLSETNDEAKIRFEKIGNPFLVKISAYRSKYEYCKGDFRYGRRDFHEDNLHQIMLSLRYNFAFFDIKYDCCLRVIERVLRWMETFLPKDINFEDYVKIHTTMLYYRAVRQSIKQRPEEFEDPVKKMSEGVDIVGFTFGRYVAKEVAELKSKYFDSVVEIYSEGLRKYFFEFLHDDQWENFVAAAIKGILSESLGSEARLASHLYHTLYTNELKEEIEKLLIRSEIKETHFFLQINIFG